MSRERDIFSEAIRREDPDERAAYLDDACANYPALRQRLENLIQTAENTNSFLQEPPAPLVATLVGPETPAQQIGSKIGPYKLMEQIGEGGMGIVYVAQQEKPVRRKVALKIIKPGMDTKQVIARFEAERQALAMMDHPNIAKILDAGMTSSSPSPLVGEGRGGGSPIDNGRPFFVMELVRGIPITEYCDKKQLNTRERLDLFIQVCRAVQHAHQKGIIHRDLKPTNILVTLIDAAPVPKVIDFGVAKATNQQLTEHTVYTAHAQMIGTPMYMSPEQAEMTNQDVDTRSDVYSLGVLLYELLTGTTPFDKETLKQAGYDEMRRIIREDEPPRPSTRVSTLKMEQLSTVSGQRDIDQRKYSHSLKGELDWIVMQAMEKDRTRRYESANGLARDVERYLNDEPVEACPPSVAYRFKKLVRRNSVALATTTLVALALLVGTGVSIWQATEANDARNLADERLVLANDHLEGETKARKDADENLRQAREAVDRYFTLVSESDLLDEPGLQPLRLKLIEGAVTFYEKFVSRNSDDPEVQLELVATHLRLAQIYHALRRLDDMVLALEEGFSLFEKSIQQRPAKSDAYLALAGFWHGGRSVPGQVWKPVTDHNHALIVLRKGIDYWEQLVEAHPSVPGFRSDLSKFYDMLEDHQIALGQQEQALQSNERLLDIRETLVRQYPDVPEYKSELSYGYWALAYRLREKSQPEEAEKMFRRAITIQQEIDVPVFRGNLASQQIAFSKFLQQRNRPDEAIKEIRQAMAILNILIDEYPHISGYQSQLESSQQLLVVLLKKTGRSDEANKLLQDLIASNPRTAEECVQRAKLYGQQKQFDKALADYDKAFEINPDLPSVWSGRSSLYLTLEQYEKAVPDLLLLVDYLPGNTYWSERLVTACTKSGQIDRVLTELNKKITADSQNVTLYLVRAGIYTKSEQYDKALADYKKSFELKGDLQVIGHGIGLLSRTLSQKQKFDKALVVAQFALKKSPNSIQVYAALCEVNLGLHQYEDALSHISKAIALAPGDSWLYKRRAEAEFHLKQFDKSLADIAKAVELNSEDTSNLWWISPDKVAACPDKDFRNGILLLADKTVELTNGSGSAYAVRALHHIAREDFDLARADLKKAAEDTEASYYAQYQIALLALKHADHDDFHASCQKMLDQFANSEVPNELHFTAWTSALAPNTLKDYTPAIALAQKAVSLKPGERSNLQALGAILFRAGRLDEALTQLNAAADVSESSNTGTAYTWFFLAMTHHQLGNTKEAQTWFTKANAHTQHTLAENKTATGEPISWNRRLTLELLQKETTLLLGIPVEAEKPEVREQKAEVSDPEQETVKQSNP